MLLSLNVSWAHSFLTGERQVHDNLALIKGYNVSEIKICFAVLNCFQVKTHCFPLLDTTKHLWVTCLHQPLPVRASIACGTVC